MATIAPERLTGYHKPTWQEAVADAMPRRLSWVAASQVPMLAAVTTVILLGLPLLNTAFIDEAIYINAGRDYLLGWTTGTTIPDHGASLSGTPFLYPVLTALLDMLGGLWLVRAFSLACVVATMFVVRSVTRTLVGSEAAGVFAAAVFGLAGPVLFVSRLGTFDALTILLIALGISLALRESLRSAWVAGLIVGAFSAVKYTGFAFAPVVIGLALLGARGMPRAVAVVVSAGSVLLLGWSLFASEIRTGVEFTTTERSALSPTTPDFLLLSGLLHVGLPALLAIVGAVLARRCGLRLTLISIGLLAAAAVLPVGQMLMGEAVSFEKHLAYSMLFLAPLAGFALARSLTKFPDASLVPLVASCLGLGVLALVGSAQARDLFQGWTNVSPVVDAVELNGVNLSSSANALQYYADRAETGGTWDATFNLYFQGEAAIRDAVTSERYNQIVLLDAPTGSPSDDAGQAYLIDILGAMDNYTMTTLDGTQDPWMVYTLEDR